jgi:hypothetical protein
MKAKKSQNPAEGLTVTTINYPQNINVIRRGRIFKVRYKV